ncbi:UDP-glucuronate 4-epimerase [Gibbsiella quercinecans]|uniref:NAD-dependent epimerase/dehydratase domain-containing protein n=1 Tax=Gibbsiella quercinecans TaxID=929813 RepID=A0A250B661_9GAMM|nr:NAD(P)-dependent oxidoreductase [Gibbsiella quercinecans]ATA21720.1 hypothetical protein AWC35_21585 [Gibbsiella quercinecans]RLM02560.1 hypothetical protein BIY31_23435 [Gibbsiella quercinecans]RLM03755.1 hypothetical protein BIY30_21505 [Gibbsiella quercinecans]TCT88983.1 UDP-glucuronate 4-epimerase [Gibbsiella quercinecans]
MTVLVTGANGFLGAAVCRALTARGDAVVAIDRQRTSSEAGDIPFEEIDITDLGAVERVFARYSPSKVVHCAAVVIGGIPKGERISEILKVNIDGSNNLYDVMARAGKGRCLHISSEEIYGEFDSDIISEDHACSPGTPYAISKLAVEQLGRYYSHNYGLDVVNVRTSWVYGAGLPRMRIPRNIVEAAFFKRPLHLPNGQDTRIDHTYIEDFVDGTLKLLDAEKLNFDIYNISSGVALSIGELVEILNRLVPEARLSVGEGPLLDAADNALPRKGALDCSRASSEVGYCARFPPELGLQVYLQALAEKERS